MTISQCCASEITGGGKDPAWNPQRRKNRDSVPGVSPYSCRDNSNHLSVAVGASYPQSSVTLWYTRVKPFFFNTCADALLSIMVLAVMIFIPAFRNSYPVIKDTVSEAIPLLQYGSASR